MDYLLDERVIEQDEYRYRVVYDEYDENGKYKTSETLGMLRFPDETELKDYAKMYTKEELENGILYIKDTYTNEIVYML